MKRKIIILFVVFQILFISATYAQSELDGRYGIGLGWSYLNGMGNIQLRIVDNDVVLGNGSVLDAPKIIVNKFGLTDRIAIEPTIAIIYNHDKVTSEDSNGDSSVNGEDERNRNIIYSSLTPIISYALLQKESVNFYIKGGISFTFFDIGLTRYKENQKVPEVEKHTDGLIFSIPLGIGIEWWVLPQLSFDITTSMNLFGLYSLNSRDDDTITNIKTTEKESTSGIFASFGNYSAQFSLVFWY